MGNPSTANVTGYKSCFECRRKFQNNASKWNWES